MAESFNSWSDLMESKQRASGKEVMIDSSGKRHKVKYQVRSSTKFVIKVINDMNIIKGDNLSDAGIAALKNFFNGEQGFTSVVGQLTSVFFQRNFIVYEIGRSKLSGKRTVQKIVFQVEERKDQEGTELYPKVPATLEFVDIDTFGTMSEMQPAVSKGIVDTANTTDVEDPVDDVDTNDGTGPVIKGNSETVKERGKKFLYTMRTNNKLYLMEFADNGGLTATTRDGSDPNGIISYGQNGIIVWSTTLDDNQTTGSKIAANQNYKLFQDSEITLNQDKLFFTKIFTDEAFRNKIIDEYEAEYKNQEITLDNLKDLLFYKDGTPIFGGTAQNKQTSSGSSKGISAENSDEEPEELDKAAGAMTDSARRTWQEYVKYLETKVKELETPAATE